jgi:probable F420-dependent oxidoreductase
MPGPGTVIAPEHTVVPDTDPGRARAAGRAFVSGPYLKLSSYTTNLRRYGYTDAGIDDGGSDRLIDALVLHGTPDIIAAGLRSHQDAGADHVAIQVLTGNGNDPIPAHRQLARVLL